MPNIRVYQFAKLLKISNEEALQLLRRGGVEVKSNLSVIDEALISKFQAQSGAETRAASLPRPGASVPKTTATVSPGARTHVPAGSAAKKPTASKTKTSAAILKAATPPPVKAAPAPDRKSTRLNSSHIQKSRMPSSA